MKILNQIIEDSGTLFVSDKEGRKIKKNSFLSFKKYIEFQNSTYNKGIEAVKFQDEDDDDRLKVIYVSEEDFDRMMTELVHTDFRQHDDYIMEVEGIKVSNSYNMNDKADLIDSLGNSIEITDWKQTWKLNTPNIPTKKESDSFTMR